MLKDITAIDHSAFLGCDKLRHIFIDSEDDTKIQEIRALLPTELAPKVTKKSSFFLAWYLNAREVLGAHLSSELRIDLSNSIIKTGFRLFIKIEIIGCTMSFILPLSVNRIQNLNPIVASTNRAFCIRTKLESF